MKQNSIGHVKRMSIVVLLFLLGGTAFANITVSGRVVDSASEPLIGVSVQVQGTSSGTITDMDGAYSLSVDPQAKLVFSYVGFTQIVESVNGRTLINVLLKESTLAIDEVVVIGYGSTSKKEITGSIATVKSENFNQGSFTNAMGMLQGKVAGLTIVNPNGADPQADYEFLLRGTNTLTSGQGPLIIIDGVAGSDMKNINFQEVESIDVLKDGSAAAIYGTRGTNGVIIITTKRAREGKTSFEYSGQVSVQVNPQMVKSLNAQQFSDVINQYKPSAVGSLYGSSTNWYDEVTRDMPISNKHSLALSGGTKQVSHRTTIDFEQNQGLLNNNNAGKFLAKTNIKQTAIDGWLTFDYNAFYSMRQYKPANYEILYQAFIHNPTEPIYDPSNEDAGGYNRVVGVSYYNPVAMQNEETNEGETDTYGGNVRMSLNVLPVNGLKWDNFISYEKSRWESNRYRTHYYPSAIGSDGVASIGNGKDYSLQYESTLNYVNTFGDHTIQALAGYSYIQEGSSESYMKNMGFDTDLYYTNNMGAGSALKAGKAEMSSYKEDSKLISFFGRVMYNYKERYMLSASLRREGSSRFGTNHKWGWFPAVSAGWRVKEEPFLKSIDAITDLKVRAGYGVTGNQEFPNYQSQVLMGTAGKFYYDGEWINTYQPVSNPNPDLRWEKKHEVNVGVDFAFLKDRIGGSVDYYYRKSTDLLYKYSVSVPPYLYTEMYTNVGVISNQGVELTLYAKPLLKGDFKWTTYLTAAHNTNKLEKFTNEEFSNGTYKVGWLEGEIALYCQRMEEGQALGTFYGPVWLGVDEYGNDVLKGQMPDGRVPESKWEVIGNANPDVTLGWTNNFTYKAWDLGFALRASIGGEVLNKYRLYYENMNPIGLKNILDSWLENPEFTGKSKYSSKYIEDGSFLKMDNLTVGYNFKFNSKYISSLRINASAQNLFTLTAYKGVDPEVSITGLEPGIESMTYYPKTTTVTLGASVVF